MHHTVDKSILIGSLRADIQKRLSSDNIYVVTDSNVARLYGEFLQAVKHVKIVEAGEQSKSMAVLESVLTDMLECGCNRKTTLIAFGGGVIGDLAGFAAAVFQRGIDWINIPTTLLSQVDSSVGGKTAVNLSNYKNMVGAFHKPIEVLIDPAFLVTLSAEDFRSGVGEVVKTALISEQLFDTIQSDVDKLLARDMAVVTNAIRQCVAVKDSIVALDFKEQGLRRVLNIGHTIGHAIESYDDHRLTHGEYVLLGIHYETQAFAEQIDPDYLCAISQLLSAAIARGAKIDHTAIAKLATSDKKNSADTISLVLPIAKGKTSDIAVPFAQLVKRLAGVSQL